MFEAGLRRPGGSDYFDRSVTGSSARMFETGLRRLIVNGLSTS